jgi:hypothetical protein
MNWLLLLVASLLLLLVEVGSFCPQDCTCNDTVLTVHCIRTHLQVSVVHLTGHVLSN